MILDFFKDLCRAAIDLVETSLMPENTNKNTQARPCHIKSDSITTCETAFLSFDDAQSDTESLWYSSDDDSSFGSSIEGEFLLKECSQGLSIPEESLFVRAESKQNSDRCAFDFLRFSSSEDEEDTSATLREPPKSVEGNFDDALLSRNALSSLCSEKKSPIDHNLVLGINGHVPYTGQDAKTSSDDRSDLDPTRSAQELRYSLYHDEKFPVNKELVSSELSLPLDVARLPLNQDQSVIESIMVGNKATPPFKEEPIKADLSDVIPTNNTGVPASRGWSHNALPQLGSHNVLDALKMELDMRQQRFGPQHTKVGEIFNLIGNVYFRCQGYEQAIRSYKKVLYCERGIDAVSDYLPIADALGSLGTVYRKTGQLNAAVDYLKRSLDWHIFIEEAQGNASKKSWRVAAILFNLGSTELKRKNYHAALHILIDCRELKENAFGKHHMEVANVIDAIGQAHLSLGNMDEAMKCHVQALETKKEFNPFLLKSASFVASLKNIAHVHVKRMEYKSAISQYKEAAHVQQAAHAKLQKRLGYGHPDVMLLAMETGDTLLKMKQLCTVENEMKQSIRYGKEARMYFCQAGVQENDLRMKKCRTRNPGIWNNFDSAMGLFTNNEQPVPVFRPCLPNMGT